MGDEGVGLFSPLHLQPVAVEANLVLKEDLRHSTKCSSLMTHGIRMQLCSPAAATSISADGVPDLRMSQWAAAFHIGRECAEPKLTLLRYSGRVLSSHTMKGVS